MNRVNWALCGMVGGLVALGCGQPKTTQPSAEPPKKEASKEIAPATPPATPESWTHKELVDHLNRKGPKFKMGKTFAGVLNSGPVVYLLEESAAIPAGDAAAAWRNQSDAVVYCQLCKTPQESRDEAGAQGEKAFASGRFLFRGTPKAIEHLKATLR